MASFVHFDLPADDLGRAKKFYEALFGWKFSGILGMDYYFIEMKDAQGNVGLAGGMGKRGSPEQRITNYLGVDSVDAYMEKVVKAGGKAVSPKMAVPGWGYLALCVDTEGNAFGLWQEDRDAK
jgi:predicted enzyme related to lactoylglutathione lyase